MSPPPVPPAVAPFIFRISETAAELALDTLIAIPLLVVPPDMIVLLPVEMAKELLEEREDPADNGCIVEVRQ